MKRWTEASSSVFVISWAGESKHRHSNQALHHDRGRMVVSRETTPLQRPRRVN